MVTLNGESLLLSNTNSNNNNSNNNSNSNNKGRNNRKNQQDTRPLPKPNRDLSPYGLYPDLLNYWFQEYSYIIDSAQLNN